MRGRHSRSYNSINLLHALGWTSLVPILALSSQHPWWPTTILGTFWIYLIIDALFTSGVIVIAVCSIFPAFFTPSVTFCSALGELKNTTEHVIWVRCPEAPGFNSLQFPGINVCSPELSSRLWSHIPDYSLFLSI